MLEWIDGSVYLWIKALHVVFVIFWMASLFMLPRFYAYHVEAAPGSAEAAAWTERETRLLRIIMNPSMILAWLLGLVMIFSPPGPGLTGPGIGWLHAKLTLLLLLTGFHGFLAGQRRKLAAGAGIRATKTWRLLNEIPGIVIIAAVILVIVKPF
jgi:protoporphyrinogen IX oxidase